MVKLPTEKPQEYVHDIRRRPRSHHNWGASLTHQERAEARLIPRTLADIDKLIKRAVARVVRHSYEVEERTVYSLLMEQYDLPLRMPCTICNGIHGYYESHAPMR